MTHDEFMERVRDEIQRTKERITEYVDKEMDALEDRIENLWLLA